MNREDIARMAREAGFEVDSDPDEVWITDGYWIKEIERFAQLVAQAEREACAKLCDDPGTVEQWDGLSEAADRIRARGDK